ncbi:TonB-dependent receptor [Fulvivirgaceae bacterium BMA12]|uniref:TonB-dependent receptor n=1 Tax=Agaribacillus aureus TaxID=3051825 RepID=A0ABT8LA41_9BACT|nr:TonB-dependent receptor [Fulvivirgaceae bacterium BMA12]
MKKRLPFLKSPCRKDFKAIGLLLALLVSSNAVFAQAVQISGQVKDEMGTIFPGVTILEKGTTNGAVTDLNGNFKLEVGSPDAVITCSYVGYHTQDISLAGRSTIDIVLVENIETLQELVVVGYGTQSKINLSGAVDRVETAQLESRPVSNISQALQGASPNLNIDFSSGEPGQAAQINIRGLTSLNGGDPLILIDGVPSDAIELNRLAPRDVESISVLKDASSAAIYGARAAFGVIIITTKSGDMEGVHVSYSSNFTTSKATVIPDKITDPYIYLRLRETSTDNTPWDNQNYSDETYQWAKERSDNPSASPGVRANPNDPSTWEYMGNRDWTSYFLSDYTQSQDHHLSLSGRSKMSQYYISGSYNHTDGALKLADDYFDRYSLRGKADFTINDKLSFGTNIYLISTNRTNPSHFSVWDIFNLHPNEWDKNPDGTWANTEVGRTGAKLTNGGVSENRYNSYQITLSTEYKIIKDALKLNADFTSRRANSNFSSNFTKYSIGFGPEDIREEGSNTATRSSTNDSYNVFNIYGTFNKQFGAFHNITAIAGFNQEYFITEWFSAQRNGVISASLPTIALATGEPSVDEYIADWALRGAFYRLNYIFNNKYIVEFNGRYDGSSKFPEDKRFGFFPSASLAWRVDGEPFLSSSNLISQLKLRTSYGSLGNQFVTEYGYIPSMQAVNGNYIIDGRLPQRVLPPSLVSPNYTWEDVSTLNFGVDLGLFEDRFSLNFDIYQRDTKGMLTQGKDLPDVLGAGEPNENAADLRTTGWELSLNYRNQIDIGGKPLSFNTQFVISDSKSEITKFDNPNGDLNQFYVGQELGEIWGLTSDGLFQTQDEIDALDQTDLIPWGALSIVPGWPKYVDVDGNGRIEKGLTTDDPKDLSVIGNVTARYRFGLNLGAEWSGFDFNVFFQGVGKRDYYPLDYLYWGFYQQPYAGGYSHLTDFYRATDDSQTQLEGHSQSYINAGLANANTDARYPVLQSWLADRNLGERVDQSRGLAIPQTRYLLNGAYLRLKNVTIGYTLPTALTDKINIARLRVFVSSDNVTEWSGLDDFYDPEAITDNQSRINPSATPDRGEGSGYAYPFQRRYSIGLNVNF